MGTLNNRLLCGIGPFNTYRVFFHEIYKSFSDILFNNQSTHLLTTGNPGTGKSCFGVYLLHLLVEKNMMAVEYICKKFKVFNKPDPKFRIWDLLKYISAPIEFDTFSATNTILFSPGKSKPVLKLFKPMAPVPFTISKNTLNMPIWTKEELLQAAGLLEVSDIDSVLKKYNLFGGIAWYCFNNVFDEFEVKRQIAKLGISDITKWGVDNDLSHIIVHRYVASDPDTTSTTTDATVDPDIHVKFASDEIAKMVYEHLSSKQKDYMIK